MNCREEVLLNILKSELVMALGCTEPSAVAFAAAAAAAPLKGEVCSVRVLVTPGIYKNGAFTPIPSTAKRGLRVAAALGAVIAKPEKRLMVLEKISDEQICEAKKLLNKGSVTVEPVDDLKSNIYIETWIQNERGDTGHSIVSGGHDNLVLIEKNEFVLYSRQEYNNRGKCKSSDNSILNEIGIDDILSFIQEISLQELFFIKEAIRINWEIAQYGLKNDNGLCIGKIIKKITERGIVREDIVIHSCIMTTAAVDVRMGGGSLPAMACGGSGNQGILASIPIIASARKLGIGEDRLVRALAFSYLVTIYAKKFLGKLSVICGCSTAAGIGCTAGMTWLLGGDRNQIRSSMQNFLAGISGIICDGAKEGCSLKILNSVFAALYSSLLALNGIYISQSNGIIGFTEEDTIKNLMNLSQAGMAKVDQLIIEILKEKEGVCK